jgi:hypothetical protein
MKVFNRDSKKYLSSTGSSPFVYICLLIFILLVSITSTAMADQQEDLKKSIQIINPRPDFSLSLRLDKGTGATYAPGERIRVNFRVSKNAYVTLFGYDTRGNIRLLFPNQHQRNQYVEANRQYYIDGVIEPGTPAGIEYVQGFATAERAIITRELERRLEEENFPKLEEGISRFTQRIKGILTALPAQRWVSSEILHYQVLERSSKTGQLRVNSSPEGAEVYLNDRYAGKTPLVMEQLNIGEYVARLQYPGYQTWTRTIQINPDRTAFISADLQRIQQYGSIAIRCNENNARIYLDGQYQGLTEKNKNVLLERVNEGFHDIRVTLSGYLDWSRRIELKSNQRVQLTVNLEQEKRTGSLEITSDVDNALIYLDGDYQRRTSSNRSVTISNLQEGTYELRIVKEDYRDYVDTIRIYPGDTYRVNVRMQREYQKGSIAVSCDESNAKIFINGTYKATTSANQVKIIAELREGVYEITIIKDGYYTWLEETWVYPGETASIFADLVKIKN